MRGKTLVDLLMAKGCEFFTGVPDSVLAGLCRECENLRKPGTHVVAANEGNAVGLAIGWWLATGGLPVVYMQNSGFSNAMNPLLSAAHVAVYSTPMLLLVGWRGMPGHRDEPQHRVKGQITAELAALGTFEVYVLEDEQSADRVLTDAIVSARHKLSPTIVLVPPGVVATPENSVCLGASLWSRADAISVLLDQVGDTDALIATTGHIGRDVHGQLESRGRSTSQAFLCVGAMGHASQIAVGVALAQPRRRVWCFDGDGAFLMHLGGAALIGATSLPNLVHIVLNNGAHGSVGGTVTCAPGADLTRVATALGYRRALKVATIDDFEAIDWSVSETSPSFVEIKISAEQGRQLGRPPEPLQLISTAFQKFCSDPSETTKSTWGNLS